MRAFINLGKLLKQKRMERRLTQNELLLLLGKGDVYFISNWESGQRAPPAHIFEKIIKVLNLNRKIVVETMLKDSLLDIQSKVYKRVHQKRR